MELIHPEVTAQALGILRSWDHLQGNVIPLLALVIYIYATEIQNSNWNGIAAAVFADDWPRMRQKRILGGLFALDATLLVLFGAVLRWI